MALSPAQVPEPDAAMTDDTALHILRQRPTTTARPIAADFLCRGEAEPRSLYIHVPFCFHKCHYCDFYSFVDTRDRQGVFIDRLVRELRAVAPLTRGLPLRTLFVGGGTPTLLAPKLWRTLLRCLRDTFDLQEILRGHGEFTVECNPETASEELFGVLSEGGVSRISVGAQSFNPTHLKTLERWHDPDTVPRALELARSAGIERRSVDLIYAIPGQTTEDVRSDLATALALPIDHLSAYNLTYEPNTAMTRRLQRGEFHPIEEESELEMFWLVRSECEKRGLGAYEISNFARPGSECRHNLAYWRQDPWLAAGPSASAHVGGHRYKVIPRLDDYLNHDDQGFALVTDHDPPEPRRTLAEIIMTGIRLAEGIDMNRVLGEASAIGAAGALQAEIERADESGWLVERAGRLALTDSGLPLADHVASCLMSALG